MLSLASDVVNNADLAEPWTIQRNPGFFGQGGWSATPPQVISAYGTVSLANPKQIDMLPQADRVTEARVFHSSTPMFVDSADRGITADVLIWKSIQYKVRREIPYPGRSWFGAIAVRMEGA